METITLDELNNQFVMNWEAKADKENILFIFDVYNTLDGAILKIHSFRELAIKPWCLVRRLLRSIFEGKSEFTFRLRYINQL